MDFEFIDESEIESVKRGRKTTVPAELVDMVKTCPKGKVILMRAYAQDTSNPDEYKKNKARVSAMFRKAGELAGVKVSTVWSPAGVPQVKVETAPKSGKSGK